LTDLEIHQLLTLRGSDMGMDLFCYSSRFPSEVEKIMESIANQNKELFSNKFLISPIRGAGDTHKEIAYEHGLSANSFFLIHYNDKSAISLSSNVVEMVKKSLGVAESLILFENEVLK
jgi:hypothetical protein